MHESWELVVDKLIHDGVAAIREAFAAAGIPINYPIEMRDSYSRDAR